MSRTLPQIPAAHNRAWRRVSSPSFAERPCRPFQGVHARLVYWGLVEELLVMKLLGHARLSTAGNPTTTSQTAFDQWFRDVDGINQSKPLAITLEQVSEDPPLYRYSNKKFFPIDDQLLGNEGKSHNYSFTHEIATQFEYRGGESFKFRGDDDVFIYINRTLVLDLGGVHQPQSATVNLDAIAGTVGLKVGQVYPLHIFFAERQTVQSQFELETSIETLAECVAECTLSETRPCYSGAPATIVPGGICAQGVETCGAAGWSGACEGEILPAPADVCGNGLDDDCDKLADEDCLCVPNQAEPCYSGPDGSVGVGICTAGTATCDSTGSALGACVGQVVPGPVELCFNGLDDDCNNLQDESCVLEVPVNVNGDCVEVSCPPEAPFPVGCNLTFSGGDDRGCIANPDFSPWKGIPAARPWLERL